MICDKRTRIAACPSMITHKTYGVALTGTARAGKAEELKRLVSLAEEKGIRCINLPAGDYEIDAILHSQCEEARLVLLEPDKLEDYDDYTPKKKDDPKPNGFDHTKFSRRKKR